MGMRERTIHIWLFDACDRKKVLSNIGLNFISKYSKMQTVLITGGTGLIGRALTKMLVEKGYKVIILTRNLKESKDSNIAYAVWDVKKQTIDEKAIAIADYIVHLAGAGVADKRWTRSRKNEIKESRVQSSQLLVNALKNTPNQVKAVISASAIGWYGDDKDRSANKKAFTEDMPANKDFLGETCRLWEESIDPVTSLNKRLVKLRTGIVLSNEGGAFAEFKKPVQFGFAAVLGNGQQAISWLHPAWARIRIDRIRTRFSIVSPSAAKRYR